MSDSRNQKRDLRRARISEAVLSEGSVRIEDLAERFGASVMTVHRDLDELATLGVLRKSRGTATALASTLVESSILYRRGQRLQVKAQLAHAAVRYIESGQSVFLDDSTTTHQIIPFLTDLSPLTLITNSVSAINTIKDGGRADVSLIALGGTYYHWSDSFMGRMTIDAIERLRGDVVIMSAPAITDGTLYFQAQETVDTKRAMLDAAALSILVVDSIKFDNRALHALAHASEFDVVIVDEGMPEATRDRLRGDGINIVVAPKTGAGGANVS